MLKYYKKHWLKYLGSLIVGVAAAASLYGTNPQTGKVYDPDNFNVAPISVNGTQIDFPCSDNNTGETAVIKTDKCSYSSWDYDYSYFSVTNISPDDQNYQIQFLDNNGAEAQSFDEFKPQISYQVEVPDYGTNKIECADGWTENKATVPIGGATYSCGKADPVGCTSISGTTCIQENVPTGTHQETRYRDEWGVIAENPNPDKTLDDNSIKPVPEEYKLKDQIQYWIRSGETRYFRTRIKLGFKTQGKFYISAIGSLGSFSQLDPSWYSNLWSNRIPIVIDHNKVASTTGDVYTSFPVLASTTSASLKTVSNGGHVGKTDGTDILFTLSDGTTKLNHELEKYASTTGELLAWVNMGTGNLSTSSDTTIYVYYGNAAASDQQNVTATWNTGYKGVYHTPNGSTLSVTDSTGNFNGTTTGSPTAGTGKIDGGMVTASNSGFTTTNTTAYTDFTLCAWFKSTAAAPSGFDRLFDKKYDTGTWVGRNTSVANTWGGGVKEAGSPYGIYITLTDGSLHYICSIRSGTTHTLIGDGTTSTSNTVSSSALDATSLQIAVNRTDANQYFTGTVDEVRVSNVARSADWVKTEYNNQNSPSTFETWGVEEAFSVTVPGVIINNGTTTISNGSVKISAP